MGEFSDIDLDGGLVCILDNIEEHKISDRFISTLIHMAHHFLAFKMCFVMCGVQFLTMEQCRSLEIAEMVKFFFPKPDNTLLKSIMKH
jgi:hypothetical protein